jgi:GntR family transcriptional regulator
LEGNLHLDHLISAFLKKARQQGFSLSEIRSRVKSWLEFQAPDHFLVIEPDRELRQILVAEIRAANSFPVNGGGFEQCRDPAALLGAVPVAMYGRADEVSAELPADTACLMLRSNSADSLEKLKLASADSRPIAVVSRWPDFLRWARAILLAKGVDCGLLSFRNASERGWRGGLGPNHQVVTDVLTAGRLPNSCRPVVLKVIADASLQELKRFVESFLASPGPAGAGRTRKGL